MYTFDIMNMTKEWNLNHKGGVFLEDIIIQHIKFPLRLYSKSYLRLCICRNDGLLKKKTRLVLSLFLRTTHLKLEEEEKNLWFCFN